MTQKLTKTQKLIVAIDQGTTSSRAIAFDERGQQQAVAQREHEQHFPRPGWVEHDASEIRDNVTAVLAELFEILGDQASAVQGIGITNQRETVVVWDAATGEPVAPAIVWQDARTQRIVDEMEEDGGLDRYREITGLPLATYFSATKLRWILDSDPELQRRADAGELLAGTMDSWVIWNLTGGTNGGLHVTDVTNASRTLLMNLRKQEWEPSILADFNIPASMLPRIVSSSGHIGHISENQPGAGLPIAGILGDQQAALFGQAAFKPGQAKNTYGTGCFVMYNTGTTPARSTKGLLTTVAYQLDGEEPVYALEGSIAVAGSLVQWLRDNLKMFDHAPKIEELASQVEDSGGCYIVPAFSGLYAPWWQPEARGVMTGLTRYVTREHIARAVLEATAFQTADVFDAAEEDVDGQLTELRVDGGMVANNVLMQFQADLLGVDVVRPAVTETTALGAAYAAGLAVGVWGSLEDIEQNWQLERTFTRSMEKEKVERKKRIWRKAVHRSFDWVDEDVQADSGT